MLKLATEMFDFADEFGVFVVLIGVVKVIVTGDFDFAEVALALPLQKFGIAKKPVFVVF